MANSTITNNVIGIYSRDGTTLTNSIVSGNAGVEKSTMSGGDIFGSLNAATSRNNLIGNAAYAGGLTNGVNGNIVGVADPGLGALANNGGPTETCALLSYSPAINAGDNSLIPIDPSTGSPFTTDQTGAPRIFNGTVDIGAVEFQATPLRLDGRQHHGRRRVGRRPDQSPRGDRLRRAVGGRRHVRPDRLRLAANDHAHRRGRGDTGGNPGELVVNCCEWSR